MYFSLNSVRVWKLIKCQSSTVIHNYGWMMCVHYTWRTNKTLNSLTNPYVFLSPSPFHPFVALTRKRRELSICFLLECYYPSPLELEANYFGLSILLQSSVIKMKSLNDIRAFVLFITVQLTVSIIGVVRLTMSLQLNY